MDALSLSKKGMKDEKSFCIRLAFRSRADTRNGALDHRLPDRARVAGR